MIYEMLNGLHIQTLFAENISQKKG